MKKVLNILNAQIRVRQDKYNLSDIIKSLGIKCDEDYLVSKLPDDAKAKLLFRAEQGVKEEWAVNKSYFYKLASRVKTPQAGQIWDYLMDNVQTLDDQIQVVIKEQVNVSQLKQLQAKLEDYKRKLKKAADDMNEFKGKKEFEYLIAGARHLQYEKRIKHISEKVVSLNKSS